MIAKASTIPHGANAIRYSVNKDRADIVKANLLPDDISPEAMYGRMMLVQKMFTEKINKGRPLGRNVIRIEISPSEKESRNWTMDDWARLADEFIRVFDSIDLSQKTKRASSKQTNLKGSQYIATSLVDDIRSHDCPLTNLMAIIYFPIHIHTVGINVQV